MDNVAQRIIIPDVPGTFRIIFLYVGQGEATIMAVPDGDDYKFVLIDCHNDEKFGGIKLPLLLKDLTDKLDVFINTHPHNDHMKGIKDVSEVVEIEEVWHSGHTPGKDHKEAFEELEKIMDDLGEDKVTVLTGTRDNLSLGDVTYNILSPAEYVSDEIDDEDPNTRYARIHEQCAVLRFCYGDPDINSILITGDSDLAAWKNHITEYHKDKLPSTVLSASHHGSRTFFKEKEDDAPYVDHLNEIGCDYLIISSPTTEESPHDHPHEDALKVYQDYIESDNILHLGANKECVIVDITSEGDIEVYTDKELVDTYSGDGDNGGGSNSQVSKTFIPGAVYTSIDKKPMGD